MIKTMVSLPEEMSRGLKRLAVERRTSFAELVREAIEAMYHEDIEDLRIGRQRLQEYVAHPEQGVSYDQYRAQRSNRQS